MATRIPNGTDWPQDDSQASGSRQRIWDDTKIEQVRGAINDHADDIETAQATADSKVTASQAVAAAQSTGNTFTGQIIADHPIQKSYNRVNSLATNITLAGSGNQEGAFVSLQLDQPAQAVINALEINSDFARGEGGQSLDSSKLNIMTGFFSGSKFYYLVAHYASEYTPTDVTAPIVSFSLTDGQTDVAIDATLQISFNEAVRNLDDTALDDANVDQLITLKETDASGADVDFDATINAGKTVITITPSASLANNQPYYLGIGATVEDASDNAIAASSITFTTAAAAPTWTDDYQANFGGVLRIVDNTQNQLIGSAQSFSLGFKINTSRNADDGIITGSLGSDFSYTFRVFSTGVVEFNVFSGSGGANYVTFTTNSSVISANVDTYISASYNASNQTAVIYINGSSVASTKTTTGTFSSMFTATYLRIAGTSNSTKLNLNDIWMANGIVSSGDMATIAVGDVDPRNVISGVNLLLPLEQNVTDATGNYTFIEPSGTITFEAS